MEDIEKVKEGGKKGTFIESEEEIKREMEEAREK